MQDNPSAIRLHTWYIYKFCCKVQHVEFNYWSNILNSSSPATARQVAVGGQVVGQSSSLTLPPCCLSPFSSCLPVMLFPLPPGTCPASQLPPPLSPLQLTFQPGSNLEHLAAPVLTWPCSSISSRVGRVAVSITSLGWS